MRTCGVLHTHACALWRVFNGVVLVVLAVLLLDDVPGMLLGADVPHGLDWQRDARLRARWCCQCLNGHRAVLHAYT